MFKFVFMSLNTNDLLLTKTGDVCHFKKFKGFDKATVLKHFSNYMLYVCVKQVYCSEAVLSHVFAPI